MGQVAYALLTRPPLSVSTIHRSLMLKHLARLACVRHAASVHPEPGSNSDVQSFPLRRPYSLRLAKASAVRPASWRFTHRILTVLARPHRSPLHRIVAAWPRALVSSVSFSRFARCLLDRVFRPCLADSLTSITKNLRPVNT